MTSHVTAGGLPAGYISEIYGKTNMTISDFLFAHFKPGTVVMLRTIGDTTPNEYLEVEEVRSAGFTLFNQLILTYLGDKHSYQYHSFYVRDTQIWVRSEHILSLSVRTIKPISLDEFNRLKKEFEEAGRNSK